MSACLSATLWHAWMWDGTYVTVVHEGGDVVQYERHRCLYCGEVTPR